MYGSVYERRSFVGLTPWIFFLVMAALATEGTALLYSAAHGSWTPWALRHALRFCAFSPIMLAIAAMPTRWLYKLAYPAYAFALFLLFLNDVAGETTMGAERWLRFGGFGLQPSEPMKLAMVMALARYFQDMEAAAQGKWTSLLPPALIIAAPTALILAQPDLGTGTILAACGVIVLFAAGVPWIYFIVCGVLAACASPLLWHFYLMDYQKKRILVFLHPEEDPLGSGYNIMQSIIAIGSGGATGKGFMQGSQSQLDFLPEHQTDFIFTLLSEELGMVGALGTLAAYLFLTLRMLSFGMECRHSFGRILSAGSAGLLFLHVAINVAMVSGVIPVVGAPLPLLSYGGTIMLTVMTAVGLTLNGRFHPERTRLND
ncbi:MAG: rod shape-determining protein RodA [Rickettsiales bacterium]